MTEIGFSDLENVECHIHIDFLSSLLHISPLIRKSTSFADEKKGESHTRSMKVWI